MLVSSDRLTERSPVIVHNVLFKLRNKADIPAAVEVLRGMKGRIEELRHIEVGVDFLKSERSYDIALLTKFNSREDFEAYRAHPVHAPVLAHMAQVVESAAVVDYEV